MPAARWPHTNARRLQGVILVIVWAAVAVFGVIILGFCGYEIRWKLARLSADTARLSRVVDELGTIEADLTASAARLRSLDNRR